MPTQAEKFYWLGLTRTLEDIDDVPDDAIQINNFSAETIIGRTVQTEAELENTIPESLDVTIKYLDNGITTDVITESFEAEETRTITNNINADSDGNRVITISVGAEQASETVTVL